MSAISRQYKPYINRLAQIPWIVSHFGFYLFLNSHVLWKGVPLRELLILKYPFAMPDAKKPPVLSVDITDACNLKCVYCNNPEFPHPRTMMSDAVVDCLIDNLQKSKINRVRIGGGEPTLHPKFASIISRISKHTKFLSIVTNAQWTDPQVARDLMSANIDLIEVSIDAGGAKIYESSRPPAKYDRLLDNLAYLKEVRNQQKSKTVIKVRLMLRPSNRHLEREESKFLTAHYCDCVLPQMLVKHPDTEYMEDVYWLRTTETKSLPVCTLPFKDFQVRPDGRVPLCASKGCALEEKDRIFVGDVCNHSFVEMWNSPQMKSIRNAHRNRIEADMEFCRNCYSG